MVYGIVLKFIGLVWVLGLVLQMRWDQQTCSKANKTSRVFGKVRVMKWVFGSLLHQKIKKDCNVFTWIRHASFCDESRWKRLRFDWAQITFGEFLQLRWIDDHQNGLEEYNKREYRQELVGWPRRLVRMWSRLVGWHLAVIKKKIDLFFSQLLFYFLSLFLFLNISNFIFSFFIFLIILKLSFFI